MDTEETTGVFDSRVKSAQSQNFISKAINKHLERNMSVALWSWKTINSNGVSQ